MTARGVACAAVVLTPSHIPLGRPRIELFARQRHEGWDAWGNEI